MADKRIPDSLGELLKWHLLRGTSPQLQSGTIGRQISIKEFASKIGVSPKTVHNWVNNNSIPADINAIERVLFGNSGAYAEDRLALRSRWAAAHRDEPDRTQEFLQSEASRSKDMIDSFIDNSLDRRQGLECNDENKIDTTNKSQDLIRKIEFFLKQNNILYSSDTVEIILSILTAPPCNKFTKF